MVIKVSGIDAFTRGLMKELPVPDKIVREKVKKIVAYAHENITTRTPVWSGRALRNWIWTTGSPNTVEYEPIDNGPTGQTSVMRLGQEPRRPPNQAASDDTFAALSFANPYQKYWLSNVANDVWELEYGLLPTPIASRQPKGMVRITLQELLMQLQTGMI